MQHLQQRAEVNQAFWRMTGAHADWLVRQPVVVLGLATAAALMVFVLATPKALPILGGLVATLAIGTAGPWLSLAGLRGRLTFHAERCRVGDPVAYGVTVTRFGRLVAHRPRVAWPAAAAGTSEGAALIPRCRGRFPTHNSMPTLESDWPFGIVTARKPLDVPRSLIVRPVTTVVRFPVALVAARRPGRDASTGLPGTAGDVLGLRDYRAGDSIRSIHWAQTARQGEVVVCERPGIAAPRVRITLEGSDRNHTVPEPRLDAAVTIASSLVESWASRGVEIEVCWTPADATVACLCPSDRRKLDEALDALACLDAVGPAKLGRMKMVDLEVLILVGDDTAMTSLRDHAAALNSPERRTAANRLVVAFEPLATAEAICVPPTRGAAAALDNALAEIGHDPDATRV